MAAEQSREAAAAGEAHGGCACAGGGHVHRSPCAVSERTLNSDCTIHGRGRGPDLSSSQNSGAGLQHGSGDRLANAPSSPRLRGRILMLTHRHTPVSARAHTYAHTCMVSCSHSHTIVRAHTCVCTHPHTLARPWGSQSPCHVPRAPANQHPGERCGWSQVRPPLSEAGKQPPGPGRPRPPHVRESTLSHLDEHRTDHKVSQLAISSLPFPSSVFYSVHR